MKSNTISMNMNRTQHGLLVAVGIRHQVVEEVDIESAYEIAAELDNISWYETDTNRTLRGVHSVRGDIYIVFGTSNMAMILPIASL